MPTQLHNCITSSRISLSQLGTLFAPGNSPTLTREGRPSLSVFASGWTYTSAGSLREMSLISRCWPALPVSAAFPLPWATNSRAWVFFCGVDTFLLCVASRKSRRQFSSALRALILTGPARIPPRRRRWQLRKAASLLLSLIQNEKGPGGTPIPGYLFPFEEDADKSGLRPGRQPPGWNHSRQSVQRCGGPCLSFFLIDFRSGVGSYR